MKEQIIQIPDTLEVKEIKDGKIILVEKEKKLTYEDIARKLFSDDKIHYFIADDGNILDSHNIEITRSCKNNANSKRQLEKLLAINMLMNVAKYLNDGWQPDWNSIHEDKFFIEINGSDIEIDETLINYGAIYFKSEKLARKAIEILGEKTIKLALCTDY